MEPLATSDDVAQALGLDSSSDLSESQGNRVDDLLARVSRKFRLEAGRPFTPGTDTVRLLSVGGRVRLPEPVESVDDVAAVTIDRCGVTVDVDVTLDGQELVCEYSGVLVSSGVMVTVTYTHSGDVSDAVIADVAAIVARHLTVEPGEGKVVSETAGPFTARYADWVSVGGLFTEDECETARSYRHPAPTVVIQRP